MLIVYSQSPEGVVELAEQKKAAGNLLVKRGSYREAMEIYLECVAQLCTCDAASKRLPQRMIDEFKAPKGDARSLASSDELFEKVCTSTLPAILSNASLCAINLENYGEAVNLASLCLEISHNKFVKGFFRRGTAHVQLREFKAAVNDFKVLTRLVPSDKDAKACLKEAERLLAQQRFAAAIACEAPPRPSTKDYSEWVIDGSYTGPTYVRELLTRKDVTEYLASDTRRSQGEREARFTELRAYLAEQKRLDRTVIKNIVTDVLMLNESQPNVVPVSLAAESEGSEARIIVCGDVHGQFYDLMTIFDRFGLPSKTNKYVFNGDFVDRGSFSLEIIVLLYMARLLWPDSFYMTRGNHESDDMTSMYGFKGEVNSKCSTSSSDIYDLFMESFEFLPLAHVIEGKVFVVHGGLTSNPPDVTLDTLNKIQRYYNANPMMTDLLWADPQNAPGIAPSKRGVSNYFGPDITRKFLQANNLSLVVRSHEMKMDGYEVTHDNMLVTVFSAPNYCDSMGNKGAVLIFTKASLSGNGQLFTPHTFESNPNKPNVPALVYANRLLGF